MDFHYRANCKAPADFTSESESEEETESEEESSPDEGEVLVVTRGTSPAKDKNATTNGTRTKKEKSIAVVTKNKKPMNVSSVAIVFV